MDWKVNLKYAMQKAGVVLLWVVTSGVATFALTELLRVLKAIEIDPNIYLVINGVVNVLLLAITKFVQGEKKE